MALPAACGSSLALAGAVGSTALSASCVGALRHLGSQLGPSGPSLASAPSAEGGRREPAPSEPPAPPAPSGRHAASPAPAPGPAPPSASAAPPPASAVAEIPALVQVRYGAFKKYGLKLINKKVVLRLFARGAARRLSIMIPFYGFYSSASLLRSDLRRGAREHAAGVEEAGRAFYACAGLDAMDVGFQTVVMTSLMWSLFGVGMAVSPELVAACDTGSITAALLSTSLGLYAEYVSQHRLFTDGAAGAIAEMARGEKRE